jgi:hypothetical protein
MTPKEKAKQLHILFSNAIPSSKAEWYESKQCALIAVEEILKAVNNPDETYLMKHSVNYWTEVKKEIEAL